MATQVEINQLPCRTSIILFLEVEIKQSSFGTKTAQPFAPVGTTENIEMFSPANMTAKNTQSSMVSKVSNKKRRISTA